MVYFCRPGHIYELLPLFSIAPLSTNLDRKVIHAASSQIATNSLPQLILSTFFVDPLIWLTLWDSFNTVLYANLCPSGVQKFNYLKAQLQSDAVRTIAGLPLMKLNYQHSITLLEEWFDQPHKLNVDQDTCKLYYKLTSILLFSWNPYQRIAITWETS